MQNRNYLFSSLGEAGAVGWGKVTFVSENPKWVAPLTDNRPTFTLFTQVDLYEYPTCGPSLIGTLWSIRHVYIMPRTQTSTT